MSENERDVLAAVIHENFNKCRGGNGVSPTALADVILAAGFHRLKEPEWRREERYRRPVGAEERKVTPWVPVEQADV